LYPPTPGCYGADALEKTRREHTTHRPRPSAKGPLLVALTAAAPWLAGALIASALPAVAGALGAKEGPVEQATHLALLLAVVAHVRAAIAPGGRAVHLFPALVCLVFLLEEIDYGQQYLGFATPELLRPLTGRSDHLNFHNNRLTDVLLPLFQGVYLMVLPLAARWPRWDALARRGGVAPLAPPVGPVFFLAALASYVLETVGYGGFDPTEMLDLTAAVVLLAAGLAPRLLFRDSGLP